MTCGWVVSLWFSILSSLCANKTLCCTLLSRMFCRFRASWCWWLSRYIPWDLFLRLYSGLLLCAMTRCPRCWTDMYSWMWGIYRVCRSTTLLGALFGGWIKERGSRVGGWECRHCTTWLPWIDSCLFWARQIRPRMNSSFPDCRHVKIVCNLPRLIHILPQLLLEVKILRLILLLVLIILRNCLSAPLDAATTRHACWGHTSLS